MPRVDAGWIVLDKPAVEGEGYDRVLDAVESTGGVLVTYPSIVTARGTLRSVRLALAVGSVILPPGSGLKGYVITSPEWVDGCVINELAGTGLERSGIGEEREITGRLVAYNARDPIALSANGVKGVFRTRGSLSGCIPLVLLDGQPVIGARGDGVYCTNIVEGPSIEFLNFTARLYASCRGR
ncbi:MAG: hypothetical protein F7C38_04360 [Desulfurococcales archaeon]|nr:hypothetical protein [Desulfurococcales archaeon]